MRDRLLVALFMVAALHPALARAPGPVCARPAVLDHLASLLRQADRPMQLEAASTAERSDGTSNLVHCAVRGRVLGYDTAQYGMQPIDALFVVQYTLELRRNGIFLRLE